jgi:hypothetical protein
VAAYRPVLWSLACRSTDGARVKGSLSLEDDMDQTDETDTDTSILLYNLVRHAMRGESARADHDE